MAPENSMQWDCIFRTKALLYFSPRFAVATLERELMHKPNLANTFTFKIEPDNHGGKTKTVAINRQNAAGPSLNPKGRGKKKEPKAHLLIGFDTEYQAVSDQELQSTIEQGAKNHLLSYQFSIKLLTDEATEASPEAEGIIIPEPDTRLSMEEFLGFAIGTLIEKYPGIVLPTHIYLIGHFIRADLPAFVDFRDKAQRLMSNVRSTFVTIDSSIPVTFDDNEGAVAEFSVSIRDTILLAPANAKSLADIGEIVGFEKIQLGSSPEEDKQIKQNMAIYLKEHWPDFRQYGIRDAQVCVRYAERVIAQSKALFGSFKMPATLTSFGTKLLLQGWKEQGLDKDQILGREEVVDKKFSEKKGYFQKVTSHPFIEEVYYQEAFITETYHGGRNEQFIFGIADEGRWRDHDLSSAYTTAMALIGQADWENIRTLTHLEEIRPLDLAYFSVDFEFPESVRFPTLPVRTSNGIIFPRAGNSKCAAPELFLARRLGAKLRFRRGIIVPSDPTKPVFKSFITTSIQKRSAHAKGTFDNLFWKEVGNSTYGKTAQGLREKRVYDLQSDDMTSLPESAITQPYFASFITSYTRAVLGEILNGFSPKVDVFSVTTDGFLSNANDVEIANATAGPLFRSFSDARKQLDENGEPLEVKHTVRQPIGWRTRGSATLKAGEGKNGIVLQKGGIKTNPYNNASDENIETVELFLNRKPDDKIRYKSGVGIKDMLRRDTDFVFRSVTKRLSMEFDWKRSPVNPREVDIEFNGKPYKHLTFDTTPISTAAEFNNVRDGWEKYDKRSHHNLKTLGDFTDFESFLATSQLPDQQPAKYLHLRDGDIKRLRRDLTRAFKKQQAGFDIILGKRHIKHSEFKEALEACGIPCSINDIDNAKRQEFKPHQTIETERVRVALETLKRDFYPELEIELLLPEVNMKTTEKSPLATAA